MGWYTWLTVYVLKLKSINFGCTLQILLKYLLQVTFILFLKWGGGRENIDIATGQCLKRVYISYG